ncbi:malto-oligosyltrehalose trehalohydrolase [Pedobacter rhizosphaerae]|uniref:Malto-oligosyltrehalose trehalohydrolase n=1 Tax=Pedobacter rhizosphaerae TaxID=390241 RepID=A0A1H9TI06_9SPHI|nr:malto-oligosyltrehalose trehalohydrolase [Pedobacter rhizosphaerae]SER96748.1 maltooligosyl trehalose hydrolase [Pedobacter rhizosphaerae]
MKKSYALDPRVRKLGLSFSPAGRASFWLWAPNAQQVTLNVGSHALPLSAAAGGYWYKEDFAIDRGDTYTVELHVEEEVKLRPDPASLAILRREGNLHSIAFDPLLYHWNDHSWKGPALSEYIIYELHVGTFSHEGTFEGIVSRLGYLKQLGITAIELMPIGQFPGERNWGYDGVFPFAAQDSYGAGAALQHFVDACHANEIAVVLDVVYNHFGPEDNFLSDFGPYFTDNYHTPWGQAVNFDDKGADGVRDFFIENALMWFRDFHIDALRLDAIHAIKDFSAVHFLEELRIQVDALSKITGKENFLIIESDLNDNRYINPAEKGGVGMDAQWIDEFHHSLRVSAGQEQLGYYGDFSGVEDLARAYNDAYVYQGQFSRVRGRRFGRPAKDNPGSQFIVFSQNHDQVGNRMRGERSSGLVSAGLQRVMAGAVLLSPFIPLLFMGEEYAERQPFPFFVSFRDAMLIESVRSGRRAEFKDFVAEEMPDPQHADTFLSAKLNWKLSVQPPHSAMLAYYRELIHLRKSNVLLSDLNRTSLQARPIENHKALQLSRWNDHQRLEILMNFGPADMPFALGQGAGEVILDSTLVQWGGMHFMTNQIVNQQIIVPSESIIVITYDAI